MSTKDIEHILIMNKSASGSVTRKRNKERAVELQNKTSPKTPHVMNMRPHFSRLRSVVSL